MELDSYVFQGNLQLMSVTGPKDIAINFVLILNPDSDERYIKYAAEALSMFLVRETVPEDDDSSYN